MHVIIIPGQVTGAVFAPASKSAMQRACAASLLRKGQTIIRQPGNSNDDKASLGIITALGAKVEPSGDELVVTSEGWPPSRSLKNVEINCGESGLAVRMFVPIASLLENEFTVNGEGSLLNRPMDFFEVSLPNAGVKLQSNNGKLPLKVKGPLNPVDITIDGSLSSQYVTGVLMAYSSVLGARDFDKPVTINVTNLKSRPYVDLTLEVLDKFGLIVPENINYQQFIFHPAAGERILDEILEYTVEGDWSGGSFLLVAGAIAGPVTVRGLDLLSTQADKAIMPILMAANAGVAVEAKGIIVHPGDLRAFHFDATDSPDVFPPAVALAAYCKGVSSIKGVGRLRYKESDRGEALKQEYGKMGVKIDIQGDEMIIHGNGKVNGANVSSWHDHRIAMSCAIAALGAKGEMKIDHAEAVKKSYPRFFDDLKSMGADVSLSNKFEWHE